MKTLLERFEQDLRRRGFELIETHLSRVFLGERDVYKLKRPVDLGFVNFTERDARKHACEAEVELNRRLAPAVYLGVLCVWEDATGSVGVHEVGPGDPAQDHEWLVHMRRLPDAARADVLLAQGKLQESDIDEVASMLVSFHRGARCDAHTSEFGALACIQNNVEENFRQIADSVQLYLREAEGRRLMAAQRTFLREHGALLQRRCEEGRIRDGHGDLRLEHLYRVETGNDTRRSFVAIDCIEFNERFRFADVCADLAFLVMDLDYHQRRDLGERLVRQYAQESGDYALYRLLDFYLSYRAVVRAKVTSILASDPKVSETTRARAASEARRYYLLALSAFDPPLEPPVVIAMAGGIASGKSTLAEAVARTRSAPILVADRVRKELLGVPATSPLHSAPFEGAYDAHTTDRVYQELMTRADHVLASGRSVILDASFRARSHRDGVLALAARHGVPALFAECRCSEATTLARLAQRKHGPSISDGRAEVQQSFADSFEALAELPARAHCVVDTERELDQNVELVLSRLFA